MCVNPQDQLQHQAIKIRKINAHSLEGLVSLLFASWPVTSLPLFYLKILTLVNSSKVDLWGRRVGLSHMLGNILTYKI